MMMNFANLKALYVNASLKKNSAGSHTRLLLEASASIMTEQGVSVDFLHNADHDIPPGVFPDMTDYGYERDEWPEIGIESRQPTYWSWGRRYGLERRVCVFCESPWVSLGN
jgi:hypothetical protein